MTNEALQAFVDDTLEHLETINGCLINLEKHPQNAEMINKFFRAAHTIKGSAGVMGFKKIQDLTHAMEDVLHEIREGNLSINQKNIEVFFICHDLLETFIYNIRETALEGEVEIDKISQILHGFLEKNAAAPEDSDLEETPSGEVINQRKITVAPPEYHIIENNLTGAARLYYLTLSLAADYPIKEVPVWFTFQELKALGTTITTEPTEPTPEAFRDGQFVFEANDCWFLIISTHESKAIIDHLTQKIVGIDKITVEKLTLANVTFDQAANPNLENIVQDIINSEDSISDIQQIHFSDFLKEVLNILNLIEKETTTLKGKLTDTSLVTEISRQFHTIQGMANFFNLPSVSKIALDIYHLIKYYLHHQKKMDKGLINLIFTAISLMRKLSEDPISKDVPSFNSKLHSFQDKLSKKRQSLLNYKDFISAHNCFSFDQSLASSHLSQDDFSTNAHKNAILSESMTEIKQQIQNININIVKLESEHLNTEDESLEEINKVYEIFTDLGQAFQRIADLCSLPEQELIKKLAHLNNFFIHTCQKNSIKPSRLIIDTFLQSTNYLQQLAENLDLVNNDYFVKIVSNYLEQLKQMLKPEFSEKNQSYSNSRIGEILVNQGKLSEAEAVDILQKQKETDGSMKFGQIAIKEGILSPKDVIDALRLQEDLKPTTKPVGVNHSDSTYIRIPITKADSMVDMLSELTISFSLLEQEVQTGVNCSKEKTSGSLMRISRILKDLQNISLSLRMVALKPTFQKLSRIVRDTAKELTKNVEIVLAGEETEIDRNVADKIFEPLMHLVRNAISHGIEREEERIGKGKSSHGTININAYSKRGNVYIEVQDDGQGLIIEKIHAKAQEKGLIDPHKSYTDDEIAKFILLPGFSTQEVVNNISGRGVGMNVVETEIAKIGGKVEIENTPGQGCKFILKIPIKLAIMNGTIVKINGEKYIIPTVNIKQIVKSEENLWFSIKGKKRIIKLRNDIIEVIPTADMFGIFQQTDNSLLLILELEQKLKAVNVDAIIGRQDIVVKPLGGDFRHLDFIQGATILGDGKVSLILDIEALFKIEVSE